MNNMEFQDFTDRFRNELQRTTANGLRAVAVHLVAECQAVLATVNAGKRKKFKRASKSGAKSHTVYGNPSRPGEPPRQRTGWGKGHVGYQELSLPDGSQAVRVGVPEAAMYLGYHEAGINYPQAGKQQRPWLVPTVQKNEEVLKRLFMIGGQT